MTFSNSSHEANGIPLFNKCVQMLLFDRYWVSSDQHMHGPCLLHPEAEGLSGVRCMKLSWGVQEGDASWETQKEKGITTINQAPNGAEQNYSQTLEVRFLFEGARLDRASEIQVGGDGVLMQSWIMSRKD